MSEVEKQESQKTVVAFITGLLIGGLLVWVFSSSPEAKTQPDTEAEKETQQTEGTTKSDVKTNDIKVGDISTKEVAPSISTGEGTITVTDQKAGNLVLLGTLTYPANSGWVVVRDYNENVPGNILGAARFNIDDGLIPTSVELMRDTATGNTYQVVYYSNGGDIGFDLGEDTIINGPSATFIAN